MKGRKKGKTKREREKKKKKKKKKKKDLLIFCFVGREMWKFYSWVTLAENCI